MLTLKGRSLLFWTLAAIPPVAALALIFGYGVNAPFFDDFLSPGELLIKSARGELSFGDLFAQHNEHRILFPRLVFLALARGGWNPRSQMLASWVAACLIAWNVFRLRPRGAGLAGSAAALISGVLIFSPLQYQNWTFAMQLMMFLPMLCVTSCLVALRSGMDWRAKLGCCFAAALVSTFSAGSGMLCWAAAIPALLWTDWTDRSNKRVALGVWLGGCAACAAIYFVGYSKPATGSLSFALDEPARALYWSLLFLGSPLAWATEPMAAIASAAAVAACGWLAWRTARADWNAAMPWIIIALYTLGVAASATLARGADGPGQALSARYVTLSIYLLVALVNLAGLWISQGGSRALGPICLAAVLGAHLFACWRAAPWIEQFWRDRRYGRACIVWSGIARNGCLNVVFPGSKRVASELGELNRLGHVPFGMAKSRLLVNASPPVEALPGWLDEVRRLPDGRWRASGWAARYDRYRGPDTVLLTYDNRDGRPVVYTMSEPPRDHRSDVAKFAAHPNIGWHVEFDASAMPRERLTIRAFAFVWHGWETVELRSVRRMELDNR